MNITGLNDIIRSYVSTSGADYIHKGVSFFLNRTLLFLIIALFLGFGIVILAKWFGDVGETQWQNFVGSALIYFIIIIGGLFFLILLDSTDKLGAIAGAMGL